MKFRSSFFFLLFVFLAFSCGKTGSPTSGSGKSTDDIPKNKENFGIILHGGAGTILKENMPDSLENVYKQKLEEAITAGYEILKKGGTSLDAVTKTITILEDSPLFNAGKGAVFTHEGRNELDASIMDGKTLKAGAVAGVRHIKNPINLARDVMEKTPHVMLYGEGAEEFARSLNYKMMDTSYFFTRKSYEALKRIKTEKKTASTLPEDFWNDSKFGTVGCAALDRHGNLAAGTSTGGMTNKRWNRIGDSPIIGAGTYANNATCAVSSTGWGEFFIRSVVAYDISALMEYKGLNLQEAAREVIHKKVPDLGGNGGIIAIDKDGNFAAEFNTEGMYRASINADGELVIGMYK